MVGYVQISYKDKLCLIIHLHLFPKYWFYQLYLEEYLCSPTVLPAETLPLVCGQGKQLLPSVHRHHVRQGLASRGDSELG